MYSLLLIFIYFFKCYLVLIFGLTWIILVHFKNSILYCLLITILHVMCVCMGVLKQNFSGWQPNLKGSYDAFLKIIILCIWYNRICWHTLMFKKHIIFQILYIIVVPLCPASLKRFIFYKVPPSDKHSLLWLANWPRALWLAEHHKHESEM